MKLEDFKTDEELNAKVNAIIEAKVSEAVGEVSGLKAKVEELLGEKKSEAQRRHEAEEAAKAKELEAAKAAGKIEEVEKALRAQFEKDLSSLKDTNTSLNNEILGGKKETLLESLSSKFVSPETAKLMLSNMVDVVRSDNGVVTNFKGLDGAVVTTDSSEFVKHISGLDSFKPLMKGVDSSGGGAAGGKGSTGGAGTPKSLAEAKTKEERNAYYEAKLSEFNGE